MTKRQTFTPEFKREAVRLLMQTDKPASEIALDLGVPEINYINGVMRLKLLVMMLFKAHDEDQNKLLKEVLP